MFCPNVITLIARLNVVNLTAEEYGALLKDQSLSFIDYLVSDGSFNFLKVYYISLFVL